MTRILTIIAALAASTLLGGWAFDRQGPYCLFDKDYTNCGFPSYQACMATRAGAGGYCRENPMYRGEQQSRRQKPFSGQ